MKTAKTKNALLSLADKKKAEKDKEEREKKKEQLRKAEMAEIKRTEDEAKRLAKQQQMMEEEKKKEEEQKRKLEELDKERQRKLDDQRRFANAYSYDKFYDWQAIVGLYCVQTAMPDRSNTARLRLYILNKG